MSQPTPFSFFEAIRRGDANAARAGYERLHAEIRLVQHALVHAARKDASGDAIREIAQSFVAFLFSDAGRASVALLRSWRGVRVAAMRWLRRERRRDRSIEQQSGLFRELLGEKVRAVLKTSAAFERAGGSYALRGRPRGKGLDDETIVVRLPGIAAKLVSAREDQSPEVASKEDVEAQLVRIFELGGNEPKTTWDLVALVWRTLVPTPDEHEAAGDARRGSEPPKPEERLASRAPLPLETVLDAEWGARIDLEAHAFLRTLKPRVVEVATLRWGRTEGAARTLEEVARTVKVSKSSADNDCKAFQAAFLQWLRAREIDDQQAEQFLERTLEILRAGDFTSGEEDPSR